MPRLSSEVAMFIGGLVLTLVLLVLDKAGKLRGGWLTVLLVLAATLTLPLAWDLASRTALAWKAWARATSLLAVFLAYWAILIWINPQDSALIAASGDSATSTATRSLPTEDLQHPSAVPLSMSQSEKETSPPIREAPIASVGSAPRAANAIPILVSLHLEYDTPQQIMLTDVLLESLQVTQTKWEFSEARGYFRLTFILEQGFSFYAEAWTLDRKTLLVYEPESVPLGGLKYDHTNPEASATAEKVAQFIRETVSSHSQEIDEYLDKANAKYSTGLIPANS